MMCGSSLSVAITTNIGIQILPQTYVILLPAMVEFPSAEQITEAARKICKMCSAKSKV